MIFFEGQSRSPAARGQNRREAREGKSGGRRGMARQVACPKHQKGENFMAPDIKKPERSKNRFLKAKAASVQPGRKKRAAENVFLDKGRKWLEVAPYGIIGGMIPEASAMLFRGKNGEGQFMVWLSELQSRIAIEQGANKERPFGFVQQILKASGSAPERCFFVKTEEGRDVVTLTFQGGALKPIQFYADEVISFCIMSRCRFFCEKSFLEEAHRDIPKRFKRPYSEKKPMYLN